MNLRGGFTVSHEAENRLGVVDLWLRTDLAV